MGASELTLTDCVVELRTGAVRRADRVLRLDRYELALLAHLADHPYEALDRVSLLQHVADHPLRAEIPTP